MPAARIDTGFQSARRPDCIKAYGNTAEAINGITRPGSILMETLIESEFPAVQGRTAKINDASH